MILGLGVDIVENIRIAQLYTKYGSRFLKRVFSQDEADYALDCSDPIPHLAGRFAVKEAAVKAFNLVEGNSSAIRFRDISLSGRSLGKKRLLLQGTALDLAHRQGVKKYHFSLSHADTYSVALVILEA